jgi:hypothetical protein
MSNHRALAATRRIFSADGASPLQYLEAVALEREESKHAAMLMDVAERIAASDDPIESVREIVQAFLQDRPTDPGDGAEIGETETDKGIGTEAFGAKARPEPRSIAEVVRACEVLMHAVRLVASLAMPVRQAATIVRGHVKAMGDAGARLTSMARQMDLAAASAGTLDAPGAEAERADDDEAIQVALRAVPERLRHHGNAAQFAAEWRGMKGASNKTQSEHIRVQLQMNAQPLR